VVRRRAARPGITPIDDRLAALHLEAQPAQQRQQDVLISK